ncbi:MAG: hypothetical protein KF681_15840 [Bdellovibrionaceae bacterium]|nr:hypothetical protein [Pseudobdellovibrionaceae bacterium]
MDKKQQETHRLATEDNEVMSDIEFTDLIIDIALGRVEIATKPSEDDPRKDIVLH